MGYWADIENIRQKLQGHWAGIGDISQKLRFDFLVFLYKLRLFGFLIEDKTFWFSYPN